MQDGQWMWYISIVPPGRRPGTEEDEDYYQCASLESGSMETKPPTQHWQIVDPHGTPPAPQVSRFTIGMLV